jgi:hypothetical protein
MAKPEETVVVEEPNPLTKKGLAIAAAGMGVTIITGVLAQVATAKIAQAIMDRTSKPKTEKE